MPKICFTSLLWTSLKFPGSWLNWRWRKCLVEKKGRSSSGVKLFFTNWEFSASFTWSCHGKIWQVNDLICQLHVQWFHPECSYFTSGSERSKQVEEISSVLTKSLGIISIKNSGTCFFSRQRIVINLLSFVSAKSLIIKVLTRRLRVKRIVQGGNCSFNGKKSSLSATNCRNFETCSFWLFQQRTEISSFYYNMVAKT